jgi:hypothetical protein
MARTGVGAWCLLLLAFRPGLGEAPLVVLRVEVLARKGRRTPVTGG